MGGARVCRFFPFFFPTGMLTPSLPPVPPHHKNNCRELLSYCSSGADSSVERQKEQQITALQAHHPPNYVKLNLSNVGTLSPAAVPQAVPVVPRGGFGKSASTFNRGVYRPVQSAPTPQQLLQLEFLKGVLPDNTRAMSFITHDRNILKEYANLDPEASQVAGSGVSAALERQRDLEAYGMHPDEKTPATGAEADGNAAAQVPAAGHNLPVAFKQETYELFGAITEYLRHFYALLNRSGVDTPAPGNAAALKIEKILAHLDLTNEKLQSKKMRLKTDASLAAEVRDGMIKVLDELLRLLTRSKAAWATYVKGF